jgi:EmrB/QacA subfamily drug resistance transporter
MTTLTHIAKRQKITVLISIMLAMFLAALDQTIVATAIPRIVQELKGLEHLSWVFTSYMLASTVIVPIYGKLSDLYGRKNFILSAIGIFIIGSILSGLSQSMAQLIIFRAIQGIGAGAIFANAFAIIGDLFPPAERGKWQGLFGGVFALSSIIGPSLGGFLTDNVSWRWNFFINLPIGILALCAIWFLLPHIIPQRKEKTIDYAGAGFLTSGLIAFLLGCVWGGSQYPWGSAPIIGLFTAAVISFLSFGLIEQKAKDPILPLSLFKNAIFTISMLIVLLTGMSMFGVILYIPLFSQLVLGASATHSGTILTPFMLGVVTASIVIGQLVSRTGKYKWFAVAGLGSATVGIYLLSKMTVMTGQTDLLIKMIATGMGIGVTFPIFTVVVQNAFEHSKLGVVTASTQLFRSIGGTIGTAILGSTLNNALSTKYEKITSDPFSKLLPQQMLAHLDANTLQGLLIGKERQMIETNLGLLHGETQIRAQVAFISFLDKTKNIFASSITEVFLLCAGIMGCAFLASFFLKEIPLRKTHISDPVAETGRELAEEEGMFPAKDEPQQ